MGPNPSPPSNSIGFILTYDIPKSGFDSSKTGYAYTNKGYWLTGYDSSETSIDRHRPLIEIDSTRPLLKLKKKEEWKYLSPKEGVEADDFTKAILDAAPSLKPQKVLIDP